MHRSAAALAALMLGCQPCAATVVGVRWAVLLPCAAAAAVVDARRTDAVDEVQSMLGALLESMSFAISSLYSDRYEFLRTRAWYGNSHIGNRPAQARAYFELAQRVAPGGTICEVGFNGGHSAAVFLAAAGRRARMVSFDLAEFDYSETAQRLVGAVFPDQLRLVVGRSDQTVPRFSKRHGRACDLFSVDGDHSYEGTYRDISNAVGATRPGGTLILDDMQNRGPRDAFEESVRRGWLVEPSCVDGVPIDVSYVHRFDSSNVRRLNMSWCTATVGDGPPEVVEGKVTS